MIGSLAANSVFSGHCFRQLRSIWRILIHLFLSTETKCGSLLHELQKIWDEVGEPDAERDTMLLEIEQECLEVYRGKVDQARLCRAQLQKTVADYEAELAEICSAMGEKPLHINRGAGGSLKKELETIIPLVEGMRKKKVERRNQFFEVLDQLLKISNEICRSVEDNLYGLVVDETNLSSKRLEELHIQLHELQKEKIKRLKQVSDYLNTINSFCTVLGMDFKSTICEIHPTLDGSKGTKDISDNTMKKLATAVESLREVKVQRMQRLKDLATSLFELWHLMDTPIEEQLMFQKVTANVAASEPDITEPNLLSMNFIHHVEGEVLRLEQLKSIKMKELVLKKRLDLEEICRKTHMVTETLTAVEYSVEAIESGSTDRVYLLEHINLQILTVKGEMLARKEILEKVEKWLAACEEESWLDEYNRDDNRYNAGRGAHLTLKHAEKARIVVNKLPAMVETLTLKVTAWEKERGTKFLYDGVRLISMLEQYNILRQEKEQERQRQKDQKRLQGQLIAEQEALFGSKPSPTKSGKKGVKTSSGGLSNRKLSLCPSMLQKNPNAKPEKATHLRPQKKTLSLNQNYSTNHHQHCGSATLSSGWRNSEIGSHPVKNHSNAAKRQEIESPIIRKPLSPVSSNANVAKFLDDQERTKKGTSQTPTSNKTPLTTPTKRILLANEENITPKTMPIPVPTTPSTTSVSMLTATTPATPFVAFGSDTVRKIVEQTEYSFEEVRAGFFCPRTLS